MISLLLKIISNKLIWSITFWCLNKTYQIICCPLIFCHKKIARYSWNRAILWPKKWTTSISLSCKHFGISMDPTNCYYSGFHTLADVIIKLQRKYFCRIWLTPISDQTTNYFRLRKYVKVINHGYGAHRLIVSKKL